MRSIESFRTRAHGQYFFRFNNYFPVAEIQTERGRGTIALAEEFQSDQKRNLFNLAWLPSRRAFSIHTLYRLSHLACCRVSFVFVGKTKHSKVKEKLVRSFQQQKNDREKNQKSYKKIRDRKNVLILGYSNWRRNENEVSLGASYVERNPL